MRHKVVTESGHELGRCRDLRTELSARSAKVTALCVGRGALLEHLGVRAHSRHTELPWSAVVRIEGKRIVVRDPE